MAESSFRTHREGEAGDVEQLETGGDVGLQGDTEGDTPGDRGLRRTLRPPLRTDSRSWRGDRKLHRDVACGYGALGGSTPRMSPRHRRASSGVLPLVVAWSYVLCHSSLTACPAQSQESYQLPHFFSFGSVGLTFRGPDGRRSTPGPAPRRRCSDRTPLTAPCAPASRAPAWRRRGVRGLPDRLQSAQVDDRGGAASAGLLDRYADDVQSAGPSGRSRGAGRGRPDRNRGRGVDHRGGDRRGIAELDGRPGRSRRLASGWCHWNHRGCGRWRCHRSGRPGRRSRGRSRGGGSAGNGTAGPSAIERHLAGREVGEDPLTDAESPQHPRIGDFELEGAAIGRHLGGHDPGGRVNRDDAATGSGLRLDGRGCRVESDDCRQQDRVSHGVLSFWNAAWVDCCSEPAALPSRASAAWAPSLSVALRNSRMALRTSPN